MPIRSDRELALTAEVVGRKLQEIQDYLGQDSHSSAKMRFPRGYIRTAEHFRSQLLFVGDRDVRDNLAYALILTDLYRWMTNRTDLFGIAKEMVLKSGIVLSGSICETLAVNYTDYFIGRTCRFKRRCERMVDAGIIDDEIRVELHWLWDTRSAIHICDIDGREYAKYKTADYNRAIRCVRAIRDQLEAHNNANLPF